LWIATTLQASRPASRRDIRLEQKTFHLTYIGPRELHLRRLIPSSATSTLCAVRSPSRRPSISRGLRSRNASKRWPSTVSPASGSKSSASAPLRAAPLHSPGGICWYKMSYKREEMPSQRWYVICAKKGRARKRALVKERRATRLGLLAALKEREEINAGPSKRSETTAVPPVCCVMCSCVVGVV